MDIKSKSIAASSFKNYFITGLVILLPLTLTILIVVFLINLLTAPFLGVVQSILEYYGLLETGFLFFSAKQTQQLVSQILILVFLFFFTVSLGAVARWFFINTLIKFWDKLIHKIPFIRSVYKTSQDVINTILTNNTKSFKQVVIVPFPFANSHSIGLVTKEGVKGIPGTEDKCVVAVFVPTTPNPTSGYLVLYDKKELVYLDMKVEEALKYIISCGVIKSAPFSPLDSTQENYPDINETVEELK